MKIDPGLYVKETYKIKSKSQPDLLHEVKVLSNGKLICDCYASGYGSDCRHRAEVRLLLKNNKLL
jgi:hypothetical protein